MLLPTSQMTGAGPPTTSARMIGTSTGSHSSSRDTSAPSVLSAGNSNGRFR